MRCRLVLASSAGLLVGLFSVATAATLTPVSQNRTVSGSSSASDSATFDSDSDSQAAPDFSPFNQGAAAQVSLSGALGAGSGYQNSTLSATSIQAVGGHAANGEGWEELGYGDGSGRSLFDVTFTVDSSVDYTLTGSLEAFDNGDTQIQFTGPGGTIYSDWVNGFILPVSLSGTLTPGSYTLLVDTQGSAYGDYFSYGYSSGYYDITLQLPAVDAPSVAGEPAFAVAPNPFRGSTRVSFAAPVPSVTGVLVYDVTGRQVADLPAMAGATSLVWDGMTGDGRDAPAGVYFLRTPGRDSRTTRITKLR